MKLDFTILARNKTLAADKGAELAQTFIMGVLPAFLALELLLSLRWRPVHDTATRFLYDAQFYHHLSDDYVQETRLEFMRDLEAAPPRFIIDIPDQSRPTGSDTYNQFPALSRFVESNYAPAQRGEGYIIYEYAC